MHVSGLDLVDGTPVLDIKPYVPVYDSVHDDDNTIDTAIISVPSWVDGGLKTSRTVTIDHNAEQELRCFVMPLVSNFLPAGPGIQSRDCPIVACKTPP